MSREDTRTLDGMLPPEVIVSLESIVSLEGVIGSLSVLDGNADRVIDDLSALTKLGSTSKDDTPKVEDSVDPVLNEKLNVSLEGKEPMMAFSVSVSEMIDDVPATEEVEGSVEAVLIEEIVNMAEISTELDTSRTPDISVEVERP
ncbi:hypothetical protein ACHAQH_007373 [Verticillium albo-atrum]